MIDDDPGDLGWYDPGTEAEDLGVVRLAGAFRRIGVRDVRGSDAGYLVGRDRHPDAGPTDEDRPPIGSAGHGSRDLDCDVGIVDRFGIEHAEVIDRVPEFLEMRLHRLLEWITEVIGTDRDPHRVPPDAQTIRAKASGSSARRPTNRPSTPGSASSLAAATSSTLPP